MKFKIHPLFIILGLLLTVLGQGYMFLAYLITVIMHELGHSTLAERYGYILDNISLMPYGAVIGGKFEGVKPSDEIKIAIAGPATNFIIAIIFTAIWWLIPSSYFITETFVYANIVTAIFNFVPVFPLDGGRIMLIALSRHMPYEKSCKIIRIMGVILGSLFLILFIISIFMDFNITVCIIGIFIFLSAIIGVKADSYSRIYNRNFRSTNLKRGITVKEIAVDSKLMLGQISKLFSASYYYKIIVMDKNLKQIAIFSETEIEDFLQEYNYLTPMEEVIYGGRKKNLKKQ